MNLYDKRNDIFDIAKVPKVLWVYRGDTHEVEVRLKISATDVYKLVFNTEQLNASIELSLVSTSEYESVWLLTISKAQSMMLDAKQHVFTMTVMKSATEYLTLYKGILNVNNSVYSNSPYLNPIVQDRKPTVNDSQYMIGMLWIDTSTNSVYALANVVNQDAIWRDLTNENSIDIIENDILEIKSDINELDLQVKAVNDNKLDASVYNNDIPLIDAELLRLENDKANKSELVASDVATSEVGVTVQDKLDEIDLGLEQKVDKVETRQVGESIITYESGVIVSVSSDNILEAIEYDVNGEVDKVTSTYADGKVYEETYTKDVNGNITKIMKVEVI